MPSSLYIMFSGNSSGLQTLAQSAVFMGSVVDSVHESR